MQINNVKKIKNDKNLSKKNINNESEDFIIGFISGPLDKKIIRNLEKELLNEKYHQKKR
ncbi:hypothetical protein SDC9_11928 [bioreactor metagenome]|uniref:Uncharacterized protein n=1 Tax=bioreactor metagenome TaxID=1076179 RepID=A0A644THQ5_9ZZZZ